MRSKKKQYFLRADKICSLKVENLNQDLFVLSEKRFVEGQAVTIQEKSEDVLGQIKKRPNFALLDTFLFI